tara:strand:- start:257 stop:451 length:195 start_codon:yes stop_codon:yes gene_type:complete
MATLSPMEIREDVLNRIGGMSVNNFLDQLRNRDDLQEEYKRTVLATQKLYEAMAVELFLEKGMD